MRYKIIIKGKLDQSWSDWLDGSVISSDFDENNAIVTNITVQVTDQPALFGILNRIRDMNLLPVSIERIDVDGKAPNPGEPVNDPRKIKE
jgi:hypothetical protein